MIGPEVMEAVRAAAIELARIEDQIAGWAYALTDPGRLDSLHWISTPPRFDSGRIYPRAIACAL